MNTQIQKVYYKEKILNIVLGDGETIIKPYNDILWAYKEHLYGVDGFESDTVITEINDIFHREYFQNNNLPNKTIFENGELLVTNSGLSNKHSYKNNIIDFSKLRQVKNSKTHMQLIFDNEIIPIYIDEWRLLIAVSGAVYVDCDESRLPIITYTDNGVNKKLFGCTDNKLVYYLTKQFYKKQYAGELSDVLVYDNGKLLNYE